MRRMPGLYNGGGIHRLIDRRIAWTAARQHGIFTRDQALRCGATEESIRWRLTVGRWERLHPRVYRLAGTTRTWRQRAMATCLYWGPRAALSHRAAGLLLRLIDFPRARVEVVVPRNRKRVRSDEIVVHWTQDPIPDEDITTIDGIPVTKPARTLLDLATVEPEEVVERCLDDALAAGSFRCRFWSDGSRIPAASVIAARHCCGGSSPRARRSERRTVHSRRRF